MTSQKWNWREHLTASERADLKEIERMIAWLDERRLTFAAKRYKLQNKGQKRARLNAKTLKHFTCDIENIEQKQ